MGKPLSVLYSTGEWTATRAYHFINQKSTYFNDTVLLDLCQGKQLGFRNSIKCATPHCTNLIFVIDHITNCVVGVQNSVIFTCFQHLHLDKVFGMLRAEKKIIKFSVKFIAGLIWIQKCIIRYCILNKKILSPHLIAHQIHQNCKRHGDICAARKDIVILSLLLPICSKASVCAPRYTNYSLIMNVKHLQDTYKIINDWII